MTALGMVLAGMGVVLVWCGIRDEDPRQVIAGVFTRNQGTVGTAVGGGASAPLHQ